MLESMMLESMMLIELIMYAFGAPPQFTLMPAAFTS